MKKEEIEVLEVEPVEKKDKKSSTNNNKKKFSLNKLLFPLFILTIILFIIFIIIMPLHNRWEDRRKTKEAIYESEYKVLVCSKITKKTNVYIETDAVKVYYTNNKAKKVDYIVKNNFYDKNDEYTKLIETCTALGSKKGDILGYSKRCLINDRDITINEEYDLEMFKPKSQVDSKNKSLITLNQNIDNIKKDYIAKKYKCE